ncbi:hypothetical protein [Xanthomonas bonasiae]|uniref:hypothetical protein n=1 Tax=Xanthomonas bonasiae TaxID=2810351 RepID=UPI001982290C|nr:hypothetical protein [Xanthomonas bonasiae]MBN6110681.1 hypothetical protein [Xanthomonas bonasiae]
MKTSKILNLFATTMLGIGSWPCLASDTVTAAAEIAALRQAYCAQQNGIDITELGRTETGGSTRAMTVCLIPGGPQQRSATTMAAGCTPNPLAYGCATLHPPTGTATAPSATTTCSADLYARPSSGHPSGSVNQGTSTIACRVYGSPTGAVSGSGSWTGATSLIVGNEPYGATVSISFDFLMGRPTAGTAIDFKYQGPGNPTIGMQYTGVAGSISSN